MLFEMKTLEEVIKNKNRFINGKKKKYVFFGITYPTYTTQNLLMITFF